MSGAGSGKQQRLNKAAKILSRLIASVLCILLLIVVSIKIYLATALPATQLSRFVTSYLHQTFTVDSLQTSGLTLVLKGVRLQNPAGFTQANLAAADSVAIAPHWGDLLRGSGRYRLIALDGIKVSLEKNGKGVWNFAQLQQVFAAKKPSAAETYVNEFVVKNGTFQVQGQEAQGISLKLHNLASKGTQDSKLDLTFEDAARNRYVLTGKARAGSDAALDLALTAPSLSLKDTAVMLKLKNPQFFEGGKGTLQMNAGLHKGVLSASGDLSFSGLHLPAAINLQKSTEAGKTSGGERRGGSPKDGALSQQPPLAGMLQFAADYSLQNDTARLQSGTLTLNKIAKLHAKGSVRGVKGEREFALDMDMDEVDLAILAAMVPEENRKQLLFGGRLRADSLHLEGNRSQGLKSATGTLHLRQGSLAKDGRTFVAGLAGTIGFSRKNAAIHARGRLSVARPQAKTLLETLDLPFGLTLSSQLKPISAEVPSLSAGIMGVPIRGRIAFDAAKANPITASLQVPAARLSNVNALLRRFNLQATSGSATVTLDVAGKSAQELDATANVQLSDFRGARGKDALSVKKGSVAAAVQRRGGRLTAKGQAQLSAAAWNGKQVDARFGYRVADRMVYLDDAHLNAGGAKISISSLSGPIPARQPAAGIGRFPLVLDMDGGAVKSGELELRSLSGRMRGSFNTDSTGRWLEGTADLACGAVLWQAKTLAAPIVHAVFSRSGARSELSGKLLGGKLAGAASFNPFAPEAGQKFEVGVSGAGLAAATQLLAKRPGVYPSGGLVDLRLKGGYSRRDGLVCRFESRGSGIVLSGGGKTLLSGAGLSLAGGLAGGNLSLSEAVFSPGKGVDLKLKGELTQAFSSKRQGSIAFSLPQTALKGIADPFLNVLPRIIQEATVHGTLAADGKIAVREGSALLEGALVVKNGQVEVASRKLVVNDVSGRLPFSLDLSRKPDGKPPEAMDFSRENYPRLLDQLRRSAAAGQVVTVGKIAFGALELGKVTMRVSAGNGVTEISSLNSSLYEGALLGKGFVAMGEKLLYRGDLLINGLSLRTLCSRFPNIKGYISGRVDGVISFSGGGKGLAGITGFTNLWAREGSGEKMLVSKEFLQRLSKQKLSGFFFSSDRPYDQAEIKAMLEEGDLTFDTLKILHTNFFGVRDLNVNIAPTQNRISLRHLLDSINEAVVRGAPKTGEPPAERPSEAPAEAPTKEFKWGE